MKSILASRSVSSPDSRFAPSSLAVAGLVTAVAAVVSVIVIRAITLNVVTVPSAFTPLSKASSAVTLTILGVIAATVCCAALNRFAGRPIAMFRRIAPAALLVSLIPDIGIWVAHAYHHTATASTVLPLMIMHVLVASLCIAVLPRLGGSHPAVGVVTASG